MLITTSSKEKKRKEFSCVFVSFVAINLSKKKNEREKQLQNEEEMENEKKETNKTSIDHIIELHSLVM